MLWVIGFLLFFSSILLHANSKSRVYAQQLPFLRYSMIPTQVAEDRGEGKETGLFWTFKIFVFQYQFFLSFCVMFLHEVIPRQNWCPLWRSRFFAIMLLVQMVNCLMPAFLNMFLVLPLFPLSQRKNVVPTHLWYLRNYVVVFIIIYYCHIVRTNH